MEEKPKQAERANPSAAPAECCNSKPSQVRDLTDEDLGSNPVEAL
jgi:hypothetical protein